MPRIPVLVPDVPAREALDPYLQRIDEGRRYSNFGPLVLDLERRLAAAFRAPGGEPRVVSVANGTLGLELALLALELPPSARVLLPALTFVASATAVLRTGLEPVLCDVDPRRWTLTPEIARAALDASGAQAVMPVCAYGAPQEVEAWDRFTTDTGVPVVIDAAGAWGNQSSAGRTPAVFSLHATKTLSAAEGGFLVSTDARFLEAVRRLSNFGIDPDLGTVSAAGTNAKLSEYHAAVGLASLDRWPQARQALRALHLRYVAMLRKFCPGAELQCRLDHGTYAILPVKLPAGSSAARVARALAERGVETRRWYCPPLHMHPAFRGARRAGALAVSQELSERLLALPFHPLLSERDIATVCATLGELLPQPVSAGACEEVA